MQFREKTISRNEDCVDHNAIKHLSFTFWTDDNKISIKEIVFYFTWGKMKLINSLTVFFFMFFEETNVVIWISDNLYLWSLSQSSSWNIYRET